MLITHDLGTEFRQARSLGALREAAAAEGSGSARYSYLTPDLVREPHVVSSPKAVRVGAIARAGQNSTDSSHLTNVEKRAIMKSASTIQYTEPEIKLYVSFMQ